MNKKLTKIFTPVDQISQGKIINSWHILQSIDALTGESPYDIKISGSLEVIGDLYLKLNEPIQDPNEGRLRYLGIDINTNKVEYVNLNSYLDPIEVDPTNRTAWNNGAGNINNNTSFGFMSFTLNETGVGNTIIGAYNANELKTGYNNIVLGFNNLNLGNNPYYNIAIGVQSLYKNNSHDNIGLGIQPLYNNINGLNNISFGTKSLFSNISGSNSIAIGGNSLYNNQGSNNIAIGYKSSQNDVNGNNRISIGSFSGKVEGSDYLEIHSYRNELSSEDPLILGNFYERWFKLNGHFILNFSQNPTTDIVNTPYQLLFDEQGNAYQAERSYSVQEINTYLDNKLDKGGYIGTAQDLYTHIEGKIEPGYNCIPKVGNGASGKVLVDSAVSEIHGKIGIGLGVEASEKLEVNGNVKATQIKDQYGTLKSQRTITITGNTTLSETHNGAALNVTNTCNITVPTGLDANFNCVIFAKGAIIVTFVNSGVTIYAPSGLLLKQNKMASLICTSTNNFNLTGELATS